MGVFRSDDRQGQNGDSGSGRCGSRVTGVAEIRAALERGDPGEAESLARAALDIDPEDALIHAFLGSILMQRGAAEEALLQYRTAAELQPEVGAFHNELGNALAFTGDLLAAEAALRRAGELSPDLPEIRNNLGNVFRAQGRGDAAATCYREALALRPDYPEALTNLGVVLQEADDLAGAREAYLKTLELDPNNAFAYTHLGVIQAAEGQLSAAEASHRAAIERRPHLAAAHSNLGIVLKDQGRLSEAYTAYQRAIELDAHDSGLCSNLLLARCYDPRIDEKLLYADHLSFAERFTPSEIPEFEATPASGGPIRIGYVSADFYSHSVASFIEPVIAAHDRSAFHVTCYADLTSGDAVTERLRASADEWRDVAAASDSGLWARIRQDRIDILVDLGGHTGHNRLGVFALRAAPVQLTWIGYPATTGLAQMDYRITDIVADPEGVADRWHTETLMRLDTGFLCYQAPMDAPAPAVPDAGRPLTFGSFNNFAKINPAVLDTWAALLKAVPDARLLLKSRPLADDGVRARLIGDLAERGISETRLSLHGRIASRAEHLALYGEVDVALDTFPYNGTTTTCEALWMGVPVVTMKGRRHAARVGASLLTHGGWPEWIAADPEDYVAIAAGLAGERPDPSDIRAQFAASPVMDARTFTAGLEAQLRALWGQHTGHDG